MQHWVSVCAIVLDQHGRVLMTRRRDNGQWEPPGGELEADETIIDALHREVREETGLEVTVDRLVGVYKNMPRQIITMVFRCGVRGGTICLTDETTEVCWVDVADALDRMTSIMAARLSHSLAKGPVTVDAHDGTNLLSHSGGASTA